MDNFEIEIKKELEKLSKKTLLLFAALTCDHLYPNYVHFQGAVKWGNAEILREAIDTVYQMCIKEDLYCLDDIQGLIDSVDLITPDTEDFSEISTSFALDACTAILSGLEYIKTTNLDEIVSVATYARDTVDMFIQVRDDFDSNDPNIEVRIATDPLMIKEKNRQYGLIKKLTTMNLDYINDSLITNLRVEYPIIDVESLS